MFELTHITRVSGRRVHISQNTLECLHGEFDVEPGNGGERCEYLKERGIESYLVVVPKGPVGKNGINGVVSVISVAVVSVSLCLSHSHALAGGFLQKLSVTSSNGNSPLLIKTTECNGSVHTACTTPEEPEELDARVMTSSSHTLMCNCAKANGICFT